MIPFDNKVALRQLELANADLLSKTALTGSKTGKKSIAKDGKFHPRVLTLVRVAMKATAQKVTHT